MVSWISPALLPGDAPIDPLLDEVDVVDGEVEAAESPEEGLLGVGAILDRVHDLGREPPQAQGEVVGEPVERVAVGPLEDDGEVRDVVEPSGHGARGDDRWRGVRQQLLEAGAEVRVELRAEEGAAGEGEGGQRQHQPAVAHEPRDEHPAHGAGPTGRAALRRRRLEGKALRGLASALGGRGSGSRRGPPVRRHAHERQLAAAVTRRAIGGGDDLDAPVGVLRLAPGEVPGGDGLHEPVEHGVEPRDVARVHPVRGDGAALDVPGDGALAHVRTVGGAHDRELELVVVDRDRAARRRARCR